VASLHLSDCGCDASLQFCCCFLALTVDFLAVTLSILLTLTFCLPSALLKVHRATL
jgi:hypothetical protein